MDPPMIHHSHHQAPKISFSVPGLGLPPDPVQVPASPKPSGRTMWSYRRVRKPRSWPKSLGMGLTIIQLPWKLGARVEEKFSEDWWKFQASQKSSPSCILKPRLLALETEKQIAKSRRSYRISDVTRQIQGWTERRHFLAKQRFFSLPQLFGMHCSHAKKRMT